jgi:predicted regulator of Ras-like GTPase activity (Roadblock/LC7/MglB family)
VGQEPAAGDLAWLIQELVDNVTEAQHAILLSADGLLIVSSRGIDRDDAEHLAAVASGVQSLTRGVSERIRVGKVQQTVIQFEEGFMFVMAAGYGACLCVIAEPDADAGNVVYEMAMLVTRAEGHLASRPRPYSHQTGG